MSTKKTELSDNTEIELKILRIYIDKGWTTRSLSSLLRKLEIIAWGTAFLPEKVKELLRKRTKLRPFEYLEFSMLKRDIFTTNIVSLEIESIQYNSPGWVELIAPASVVIAMLGFLKHYIPNRKERAEIAKIRAEAMSEQIDNLKKAGFTDDQIKQIFESQLEELLNQSISLFAWYQKGNITGLEIKDVDKDGNNPNDSYS